MIEVMKNKFNCDWLSVESKSDMKKVKVKMMDNGEWEYDRVGVGVSNGRVFVVDLDDSGEVWREMVYCDKVKSVDEVLKIGIECGVFEKIDWGYGENDKFRFNMDSGKEEDMKFMELVGGKSSGKLYSMLESE